MVSDGVRIVQSEPLIIIDFGGWWLFHDNGGEINVEKINSGDIVRSISYTSNRHKVDTMTMAYRLLATMRGDEVDYNFVAEYGQEIIPDR
jgi:hypothetical protein